MLMLFNYGSVTELITLLFWSWAQEKDYLAVQHEFFFFFFFVILRSS